jgi:adenosylcobinamide-GDP ribazoletransferase
MRAGGLGAAFAFLTRLPLPARSLPGPGALEASVAWFPVVGAAVGGLAAIGLLGAAWLWPSPLPALAAVAVAVAATGGFHEDGLADTADAFAAGGDLERRLRVMDDPRIGAVGAVVLVLVLLGRVAALALLPLATAAAALVAAHTLARWSVPALLWRLPYVRGEAGIAARLKHGATGRRLAAATALALVVVVSAVLAAAALAALPLPAGLSGPPAAAGAGAVATNDAAASAAISAATAAAGAAIAATLLVTLATGALFRRRFGGVTGDLLGAACQGVELAVYLAVLAVVHRGG